MINSHIKLDYIGNFVSNYCNSWVRAGALEYENDPSLTYRFCVFTYIALELPHL